MSTTNRPLWQMMQDAFFGGVYVETTARERRSYAAELRAIADWLVPEEPAPHRGMRPGGSDKTYQETLSVERQRLRAMLLDEADRAEVGA
jgi:hypothetical protein